MIDQEFSEILESFRLTLNDGVWIFKLKLFSSLGGKELSHFIRIKRYFITSFSSQDWQSSPTREAEKVFCIEYILQHRKTPSLTLLPLFLDQANAS